MSNELISQQEVVQNENAKDVDVKKMNGKKSKLLSNFSKTSKANELGGAQLAFLGDAVYEMLVRGYIVEKHNYNVHIAHKEAIKFVSAKSQAKYIKKIEAELTDEEISVYKRGRNAKITSPPKNQEMIDYRMATGLESLFGYLYLKNRDERILEIFDMIIEKREKE